MSAVLHPVGLCSLTRSGEGDGEGEGEGGSGLAVGDPSRDYAVWRLLWLRSAYDTDGKLVD